MNRRRRRRQFGPGSLAEETPLSRPQRLFIGILVLLIVDIIWVASSEFTEYIFHDLDYDKPYFTTWFKSSMFIIYLLGFMFHRPWQDQCGGRGVHSWLEDSRLRRRLSAMSTSDALRRFRYQRVGVNNTTEEDPFGDTSNEEYDFHHNSDNNVRIATGDDGLIRPSTPRLSSPTWVPVNIPAESSGKSSSANSESEAEASLISTTSSNRRVRFSQVAEVVEMHPADALYANLARLSYSASLRAKSALQKAASKLTLKEVIQTSGLFFLPMFIGNYAYQAALSETEVAVVNVLSTSSCVFTLVFGWIFPAEESDKFSLSKLCAVLFSGCGVALVSFSQAVANLSPAERSEEFDASDIMVRFWSWGVFWTLTGAFFYSAYIVLLRRRVNHEDNMDSPMFFGFIGLFNALCLWPGLLILHFSNLESFQVPDGRQVQMMVINGIIGTVFSELLWLWGCFLTSSLIATLAISLTIPMSIAADIVWKRKTYGPLFYVGAIPMFLAFFVVAMLTHYRNWDPVGDLLSSVIRKFRSVCGCRDVEASENYPFDESDSLIESEQQQLLRSPTRQENSSSD